MSFKQTRRLIRTSSAVRCAFEGNDNWLPPLLSACVTEKQQRLAASRDQKVIIQPLGFVTVSRAALPVN